MTKSVPPWNTRPANIDGFTPEQRFFLGWAQVWAGKYTPEAERQQVAGKRARVCPAGASTAHSQTCPNSPPPSAANRAPRCPREGLRDLVNRIEGLLHSSVRQNKGMVGNSFPAISINGLCQRSTLPLERSRSNPKRFLPLRSH